MPLIYMSPIQCGGLKLKDTSKLGFQPIIDMVDSASGSLDLLTYSSLKGFMLILKVAEEDSEYLGLSNSLQFTKTVTSFILKFAVITPLNNETLPPFRGISKASEAKESFYEEAKLQQHIWKTSIIGKRPEICPPVANFCLFDVDNSQRLCAFFQSRTKDKVKEIFDYFHSLVGMTGLGVIVMPNVEQSTTLEKYYRYATNGGKTNKFYGIPANKASMNEVFAEVTAQIIRLFIITGVIHYDLHMGNVLVFAKNGAMSSILIDFGRASDFTTGVADDYLSVAEKKKMKVVKEAFFDKLYSLHDGTEQAKTDYVLTVLDYIANSDWKKNQRMFNFTDKKRYQMSWYEHYPRTKVPLRTFSVLEGVLSSLSQGLTSSTIRSYERQGYIKSLSGSVDEYMTEFPLPPSSSSSSFSNVATKSSSIPSLNNNAVSSSSSVASASLVPVASPDASSLSNMSNSNCNGNSLNGVNCAIMGGRSRVIRKGGGKSKKRKSKKHKGGGKSKKRK